MAMNYEELDQTTREHMLAEFDAEQQSADPYRSKALSAAGLEVFPGLMRQAIEAGSEETLFQALNDPEYWDPTEEYVRGGVLRTRNRNARQAAEHEGLIVSVREVYDGHRARYWPEPGNADAFSIPFGPGCHHVIRRVA